MSNTAINLENMQSVLDMLNHCRVLGFKAHAIEDKRVTIALPYSADIVGNPVQGIIHGGALTTLLDTTCGLSLAAALGEFHVAPTLDLRIDYMTAAKPEQTIYASAEAYRITRNVIFCRGLAHQDGEDKPIAHCVATFMRLSQDIIGNQLTGDSQ